MALELHVETFGSSGHDPVLLVSGADAPATRWSSQLIESLLDDRRFVVRFDNRDCGLSAKVDAGEPYTLDDLADDAFSVLDGLDLAAAHVIGRSMGGMIGQVMALARPNRVRSLTLLGSSPGTNDDRLPGAEDWLVDKMATRLWDGPPPEFEGRVAWTVDLYRLFTGRRYPFDEAAQRAMAEDEVRRMWYPESGHGVAVYGSPSRVDRLDEIATPTLVVHGTDDAVVPVEHALVLTGQRPEISSGIPDSTLWLVDGLGHEVPDALLPDLMPQLLRHLRRATP